MDDKQREHIEHLFPTYFVRKHQDETLRQLLVLHHHGSASSVVAQAVVLEAKKRAYVKPPPVLVGPTRLIDWHWSARTRKTMKKMVADEIVEIRKLKRQGRRKVVRWREFTVIVNLLRLAFVEPAFRLVAKCPTAVWKWLLP